MRNLRNEYKFRGWNIEPGKEKKWVYGSLLPNQSTNVVYIKTDVWTYQVDSESVGQYTGWNDKNNKEIYEGDVVKAKFEFDYKESYCRPFTVKINSIMEGCRDAQYDEYSNYNLDTETWEIIGNEYEQNKGE